MSPSSDNTLTFEAFADYFGGAKGQPSIGNLVIRTIPEASSRIAALRTGEIDIARSGSISPDQVATLRGNVRAEAADILRVWYFQMDTLGTSGTDVFTDVRVRQAVNHAINRDEIVNVLLNGFGTVIDTPCNPVQFGCDPAAATVYEYDPERALELLAEAGYPDGFSVDMYSGIAISKSPKPFKGILPKWVSIPNCSGSVGNTTWSVSVRGRRNS